MLCMVKMPLKAEVGSCVLDSHGHYIVDHGKSWKNHGIVILIICGNPVHMVNLALPCLYLALCSFDKYTFRQKSS